MPEINPNQTPYDIAALPPAGLPVIFIVATVGVILLIAAILFWLYSRNKKNNTHALKQLITILKNNPESSYYNRSNLALLTKSYSRSKSADPDIIKKSYQILFGPPSEGTGKNNEEIKSIIDKIINSLSDED